MKLLFEISIVREVTFAWFAGGPRDGAHGDGRRPHCLCCGGFLGCFARATISSFPSGDLPGRLAAASDGGRFADLPETFHLST